MYRSFLICPRLLKVQLSLIFEALSCAFGAPGAPPWDGEQPLALLLAFDFVGAVALAWVCF